MPVVEKERGRAPKIGEEGEKEEEKRNGKEEEVE